MKYISDLKESERISGVYLVKSKQTALTKAGKPYENLILQDKSGTIDSKVWDVDSPGIGDYDELDYIDIVGDVTSFQGKLQLNVKRIRRALEGEYDPADYLPVSKYDIEEMYSELKGLISSVKNEYLNKLLDSFFADEEFAKVFKKHSAAKTMHHGFVGGLLEHTLSVAKICDYFAGRYEILNRDLLISAAIMHDIGKTEELSAFPANNYTDDGQLLGHIIIGTMKIKEHIKDIPGFPQKLESELEHCILAHHGELEFGSPKKPALVEAIALSMADNLDAKMEMFAESLANVPGNSFDWLGFNRGLDSNIRRTSEW
ncbi:MAG: HD domain-containing protein [Eubacterium sp.]|nr:HD domain-containing protein [Eubacterium sp.]